MADAQYVVDVAAQMSGGAQTIAQVDALASTLMAAGVSADNLHDAVALATNALASAKTSSAEANAALAAGATEFKNLEQAALQAGKAQEKAAKLGVVPPEVASSLEAANAALAQQTGTLRGLEGAAAAASAKEAQLAQTLTNTKAAAAAGTQALAAQANEAKAAGDAAAKAAAAEAAEVARKAKAIEAAEAEQAAVTRKSVKEAEGFAPLTKQLGDFGDAMETSEGQAILLSGAVVGVAAGVVAITVAVIAGVIALASYAVGLADTSRTAGLVTEATEVLHPELEKLHGTIDGLTDSTGLSENALDKIAISLKAAHVSAKDLPGALEAAADAEAALGSGGAQDFVSQMQASGKSVAVFSKQVSSQLGGVVAAKLHGLDGQTAQFHKNLGNLFGGLNIEPVLGGLETLVNLFDENTAAGKTIKDTFETVFQPLIDQAQNAAYVVEAFVLGFLIGMTKLYIAVKPAIAVVGELFGFDDMSLADVLDVAKAAGEAIVPVFVGFVAIVGAITAAIGGLLALPPLLVAGFIELENAVFGASEALGTALANAIAAAFAYLSALPAELVTIGGQLMQGLANGITGAAGAVIGAITGAVGGAIDSAKHLLGIHSPSTVFAEIGDHTGAGFVQGIDGMTGAAQDAMSTMVEPPDTSAPAITGNFSANGGTASSTAQAGGAASKAGGGSLLGSNNTFKFYGVADAEQAEGRFEEMLLRVLEGDASSLVPTGPDA